MSLKYVAAFLMANLSGKEHPTAADVQGILNSIGADVDMDVVKKLIKEMEGKEVHEVVAAGMSKMQSLSLGGGGAAPSAAAAAGGAAAEAPAKAAEPEKEEEPEEEEDMGFSLFD